MQFSDDRSSGGPLLQFFIVYASVVSYTVKPQ